MKLIRYLLRLSLNIGLVVSCNLIKVYFLIYVSGPSPRMFSQSGIRSMAMDNQFQEDQISV